MNSQFCPQFVQGISQTFCPTKCPHFIQRISQTFCPIKFPHFVQGISQTFCPNKFPNISPKEFFEHSVRTSPPVLCRFCSRVLFESCWVAFRTFQTTRISGLFSQLILRIVFAGNWPELFSQLILRIVFAGNWPELFSQLIDQRSLAVPIVFEYSFQHCNLLLNTVCNSATCPWIQFQRCTLPMKTVFSITTRHWVQLPSLQVCVNDPCFSSWARTLRCTGEGDFVRCVIHQTSSFHWHGHGITCFDIVATRCRTHIHVINLDITWHMLFLISLDPLHGNAAFSGLQPCCQHCSHSLPGAIVQHCNRCFEHSAQLPQVPSSKAGPPPPGIEEVTAPQKTERPPIPS